MSWGEDLVVRSRWSSIHIPDNVSLTELLFSRWQTFPKGLLALHDVATGERVTYSQLRSRIVHLARELKLRNVRHGDRICIFAANHIDYAVVAFAGALVGAVMCFYNPLYTTSELAKLVKDTQPVLAVANRANVGVVRELSASGAVWTDLRHILLLEREPAEGYDTVRSVWAGKDEVADDDTWKSLAVFRPREDVCFMPYSSGTTGLPKGVMLTHYNMVAQILQGVKFLALDPKNQLGSPLILVVPMYHASGLVFGLGAGLADGRSLHLLNKFDPEVYLQQISQLKCHLLAAVPPMLVYLNKSGLLKKYDLSAVTDVVVGAAPLDKETEMETSRLIPSVKNFSQLYGMTEATCVGFGNSYEFHRAGSVGHPLPNFEAVVVDPESGKRLGPGQRGEIWMRGPNIMKGYWRRPEATASTLDKDGWLHSGDIGYFDADGFLFIVDRLKELIKYKGFQVAPAELEGILLTHPDVADSAVVGMPDHLAGELPRGYVVLKPGRSCSAEDIVKFVDARVSPQKRLRGGVCFVKEIPKSAAGKILRRVLRDSTKKEVDATTSRL